MQFFSILCTTCGARLKVRDRAAIGQILSCPKCGSMVMVQPPPDWSPDQQPANPEVNPPQKSAWRDEAATSATAPLTATTFDDAAAILSDEPPSVSAPVSKEPVSKEPVAKSPVAKCPVAKCPVAKNQFTQETCAPPTPSDPAPVAGDDALESSQPPVTQPPLPSAVSEPVAKAPPVAHTPQSPEGAAPTDTDQPILPNSQWSSPAAQRWQYWMMLGCAAVAGVALAVGIFAFALGVLSKTDPPAVAVTENPNALIGDNVEEDAVEPSADSTEETELAEANDDETESGDAAIDASPFPIRKPPIDGPPDTESPKPEPATTEKTPPSDTPPGLAEPDEDKPDSDSSPSVKPLPDAFDNLAPFIDPTGIDSPADGGPAESTPKEAPDLPSDARMGEPRRERPEPREIDVAARLSDEVAGIAFEDIALTDLLQFLTEMSTVPISLDIDALTLAGVSPAARIDLRQNDTTLAGLLDGALESLGLSYTVDDGQIVVTRLPADEALSEITYDVADLVADDEQLEDLKKLILRTVAPDSWQEAGGPAKLTTGEKSLVARQSEAGHFQLLLLVEKLRVSRRQPPRSSRSPSLFRLTPRFERAASKLAEPISINFIRPTPLVRILQRIHQQTGVRAIIDWRSLATVGWTPEANATLVADKQPLHEALTALLRPMDLTYRVIDATTLQITTAEALEHRPELELHDLSDLLSDELSGDLLVERVRTTLGGHHFQESGGVGALHFDIPGKHLLAYLSQPQQVELAKLLVQWRAEK